MGDKFKAKNGMTVIEICVYTALSLLLIVGVSNYLFQAQKLFHRTSHTSDMLANKIDAFTFITRDLSSAKRILVGSLLLNGDFETEQSATLPSNWANTPSGNGAMTFVKDWADASHSGIHSISLARLSGAEATYDSQVFTLTPGNAYMITAWVKCSGGGTQAAVRITDNSGFVQVSSATVGTTWHQIAFRYPAANAYENNGLALNQAKIRLGADLGTSLVYFDDVAVTPIQSVLASPNGDVNVLRTVTNVNDPTDAAGFHFVRWEDQKAVVFRYRIDSINGEGLIVREKFDDAANAWTVTARLGRGISLFRIDYDSANLVPTDGKDVPFNVSFRMKDTYMRGQDLNTKIESMMVYPSS